MYPTGPFIVGANVPWVQYGCDFGSNAWSPEGGLGARPLPDTVVDTFDQLARMGTSVLRWFLFCDGRAGISFNPDGSVRQLDPSVFRDVDAALAIAAGSGLRVMFVLFDFNWCHRRRRVNGVDLGGRRRLLIDPTERRRLIDRVVAPLLDRYGRHPAIWAWDVINEPEWVTFGVGTVNPLRAVSSETMRRFIDEVATEVHNRTAQPVTVGLASARWLPLVGGTSLDFHQVHWYDWLDRRAPLDAPVAGFALDRPVVLGEFPTRGSAREPSEILDLAQRQGYGGALFWSALATDRATDGPRGARAIGAFTSGSRPTTEVTL
jgi:hypothetical protein